MFRLLHSECCRLTYELENAPTPAGTFIPNYWQTQLQGQDPARYTQVLETLTNAPAFPSTFRTFTVLVPAGVTSVNVIFSAQQVVPLISMSMCAMCR